LRAAPTAWLLASCLAASLAAEDKTAAPAFVQGERVQVWLAGDLKTGHLEKISGTLESVSPEAIVVRPRGAPATPITLKLSKIERAEVVRGKRSHWPEGAGIGFVTGAVLGGIAGYALSCDDYNASCNGGTALAGGLVVGVATGGLGALVGLAFKTDRWVKVPLPKAKVALTLLPTPSGFRGSLSVRF
jgi:hypothetical protein